MNNIKYGLHYITIICSTVNTAIVDVRNMNIFNALHSVLPTIYIYTQYV